MKTSDCIFCKIVHHEIPSDFLYQDDQVVAFRDIAPKAPCHVLIVPCRHIATVNDLAPEDQPLIGNMVEIAKQLAQQLGIDQSGYRLIFNCNADGGQVVYHLHLHLLGGRPLHF